MRALLLWTLIGLACGQRAELTLPPPDLDAYKQCPTSACGTRCREGSECTREGLCAEGPADCSDAVREEADGWDDPPGTGLVFVVSDLAVADRGVGFDLDGSCVGDCVDNAMFELGQLGNDQIRQSLLGGESLLLIEVAGLDDREHDPSVTVKVYLGLDADEPFFPANDFSIPTGETRCCEYRIDPESLQGGQAIHRFPARVARGWLRGTAPGSLPRPASTATVGLQALLAAEELELSVFVPPSGDALESGLMGGVLRVGPLSEAPNPYCRTLNNLCQRTLPEGTLLDLVASMLGPPDLDLDNDGIERVDFGAEGRVERCVDGCGSDACLVPPLDPMRPASCAQRSEMRDGYSIGMTFRAVAATVRGIGR